MGSPIVRKVLLAALGAALSPAANAQQFGPAQQQMPGYYTGPSPVFPGYQQAPVIGGVAPMQPPEQTYEAPATAYPATPQYMPSYPRYLPTQGGGLAGSTFNPRQ